MLGKRYGNYLFILYMFIKLFYIGQALFQLFALNLVIGEGQLLVTHTSLLTVNHSFDKSLVPVLAHRWFLVYLKCVVFQHLDLPANRCNLI